MKVLGDVLQEELLAGPMGIRSRLACLRHYLEEEGQRGRVILPRHPDLIDTDAI